jgi:Domain of Unknown Function (DUF1540)
MRMTIEMPKVDECDATGCAYNVDRACHARAITIGHGVHPGCDTYVTLGRHVPDTTTAAGVGACKVESCRYNHDLECAAPEIHVEQNGDEIECATFWPQ